MDWVTLAFLVGGLLGAFFRAWATEAQDTLSRQTITDVVLGGVLGLMYPSVPVLGMPGGNLVQKGGFMFVLTYMGLYTLKDLAGKWNVRVPAFTPPPPALPPPNVPPGGHA